MNFRLLVLRTADPKKLADFYSLLGLTFDYHKHGSSPYHYSASIGAAVLEIYPLMKNQPVADSSLRLGFEIADLAGTVNKLREQKVLFSAEPAQTDFRFMAIICDPDGRKIELYQQ